MIGEEDDRLYTCFDRAHLPVNVTRALVPLKPGQAKIGFTIKAHKTSKNSKRKCRSKGKCFPSIKYKI